jgi:hypothetical protein
MLRPGFAVFGSIGVTLPLMRFSALFTTQSVFRSQDGTTCCGLTPVRNRPTTFIRRGSMTVTSPEIRSGT